MLIGGGMVTGKKIHPPLFFFFFKEPHEGNEGNTYSQVPKVYCQGEIKNIIMGYEL